MNVRIGLPGWSEARVTIDVEGDGLIEYDGMAETDGRWFTYERPGIYVPTVRITTPEGEVFTRRGAVEVYDGAVLDARLQALQEEQSRVEDEWQQALQDGRGLSATLSVGVLQDSPPDVSQPRPAGSAVLVGGLAGFLAWGLFELARISAGRRT